MPLMRVRYRVCEQLMTLIAHFLFSWLRNSRVVTLPTFHGFGTPFHQFDIKDMITNELRTATKLSELWENAFIGKDQLLVLIDTYWLLILDTYYKSTQMGRGRILSFSITLGLLKEQLLRMPSSRRKGKRVPTKKFRCTRARHHTTYTVLHKRDKSSLSRKKLQVTKITSYKIQNGNLRKEVLRRSC